MNYCELQEQVRMAVTEFLTKAKLEKGDIMVIGCSSSEIAGQPIGSDSNFEIARAVFGVIYSVLSERGIFIAAQCCEHLNRAIILEKEAMRLYGLQRVNVVPAPKAGGSFATAAYETLREPVAVESVCAQAGMDIGSTLIGMHLARVAVPVRLENDTIGAAKVIFARTRPKFVGGARAHYDDNLL